MAASDLTTLALPEQSLPPEVVTESSQLVGRLLAIATPAGTPLTTSMVVSGTSLMLGGRIAGRQSVAMPVRLTDAGACEDPKALTPTAGGEDVHGADPKVQSLADAPPSVCGGRRRP